MCGARGQGHAVDAGDAQRVAVNVAVAGQWFEYHAAVFGHGIGVVHRHRCYIFWVVYRHGGGIGGLAGGVAHGVADRGRVAFEAVFRCEGDRASGRVNRPNAFTRYGQGFTIVTQGAAARGVDNDHAGRVDVVVGVGVVAQYVYGDCAARSGRCDRVVRCYRCVLRVVYRHGGGIGGLAGGVAHGVADRGRVAFEAVFRCEGDRASGRVNRPNAFTRYGQGFTIVTQGAATWWVYNFNCTFINVTIGITIICQHIDGNWLRFAS